MSSNQAVPTIRPVGDNPTILFAAQELSRVLGRMLSTEIPIIPGEGEGILVGLMSAIPSVQQPEVDDPWIDDATDIDVRDGRGYVAGINPRSVLLAVYRYLTELGCRWVRPGADGEYIPSIRALRPVTLAEAPSYRHRGICIEGAVSFEHVRDTIDWLPKVGFNAYFTQFREAHQFFDRWYAHQRNPLLPGEPITQEQAGELTARAVEEISKRGLVYHAVGHGWTCEALGIPGLGWDEREYEIPEGMDKLFAEVNGKRELWGGIPINTSLCYSNPEARRLVVDEIVRYAEAHPRIDILHFWLADAANNNCECEDCRKARPSDFYLQMLNDLGRIMEEKQLATRVVFLIYVDLLWPAESEKIERPDRFVLMFAPITRTYSKSFSTDEATPAVPPFERNALKFPKSVAENVAFLSAWQKEFPGDSFDFDYHMMWDHYNDPGYTQTAEIISQDMKGLRELGLNGLMSCQVQRAFLPTGLPMVTMGRTLWQACLDFDEIASDYFASAYGSDGWLVRVYLQKLTELFDPVYLRGEKPVLSDEAASKLSKVARAIDGFRMIIARNLGNSNECRAKSWLYLSHHADLCLPLAAAYRERALGNAGPAREHWEKVTQIVRERENILHPVLDVYQFISTLDGRFPAV